MINHFQKGDKKIFERTVMDADVARFDSGEVHPFYGTFALARDAEWSSRLFVLEMTEDHEEGIGTFVQVKHLSPAMVGDEVQFIATLREIKGNNVTCDIVARVGDRVIAECETGQKIITRDRLDQLQAQHSNG